MPRPVGGHIVPGPVRVRRGSLVAVYKRAFDLVVAGIAGMVAAPIVALAAVGIKLADRGPVFYLAPRAGLNGTPFNIFKLRTMRVQQATKSQITAFNDDRVFPFGALLRMRPRLVAPGKPSCSRGRDSGRLEARRYVGPAFVGKLEGGEGGDLAGRFRAPIRDLGSGHVTIPSMVPE